MLFLFKQLKRKMISNNKVSTYLLYAVGEIILVVVGILIAVKIDQTNKAAEDQKLQLKYYADIIVDLKKDSTHFAGLLNNFKTHLTNYYKVYDEANGIHNHENPTDFDYLLYNRTFSPVTKKNQQNTIEKLNNTRIRDLLNNYFQLEILAEEAISEFNLEINVNSRAYFVNNDAFNEEHIFQEDKFDFLPDGTILNLDKFHELASTDELMRILIILRISGGYSVYQLRRLISDNQTLLTELRNRVNN